MTKGECCRLSVPHWGAVDELSLILNCMSNIITIIIKGEKSKDALVREKVSHAVEINVLELIDKFVCNRDKIERKPNGKQYTFRGLWNICLNGWIKNSSIKESERKDFQLEWELIGKMISRGTKA